TGVQTCALPISKNLFLSGENRFLPLPQQAALARKEQVLCELLRNGRAAGDELPATLVLVHRALNAFPIEAFVLDELCVLRDDDGALQVDRDSSVVGPFLLERLGLVRSHGL